MVKVLFVCLGNICRSPTGEGVFKKMVAKAGLNDKVYIDSCGTSSNHTGEPADVRMRTHAEKRGYELASLARGLTTQDLEDFDYILAMDDSNYKNITSLDPDKKYENKIHKMASFCKGDGTKDVPDPYYGGPDGFETVLDIIEESCGELLEEIRKKIFENESQRL